jgi:hypothetical protein
MVGSSRGKDGNTVLRSSNFGLSSSIALAKRVYGGSSNIDFLDVVFPDFSRIDAFFRIPFLFSGLGGDRIKSINRL